MVDMYTLGSLVDLLLAYGVPVERWGTGESKTASDLLDEIETEETILTQKNGNLVRQINVATGYIFHVLADGKLLRLAEEKQVFVDGRVRKRPFIEPVSVAEKFKHGEDPMATLQRCVLEELGLDGQLLVTYILAQNELRESQSYPGLSTYYIYSRFAVYLTLEQYNALGYQEVQEGKKTTFFIWKEI